jgi:iron complex outermembrane receptor protein
MLKASVTFMCTASLLALASPAIAQDSTAGATGGEIVVTAQRRAENVQDVPISISVVSGDTLTDNGIVRFEDLGATVPNFTVSANANSDTISIRGINSDGQPGSEQSVGVYVDGVYRGRGVQSRFAFLDLQRIEVLRGPQGTLFGKNTIAGAVSITSARPTDQLEASLQGLYEFNNNEVDLRGHISGPLADGLSARVAFLYNRLDDGWVTNALTNTSMPQKRDWAVRGSIKWEPSDTVEINARYEHGDVQSRGAPYELVRIGPSLGAVQSRFNFVGLNGRLDGITSVSNSINPFAAAGLANQPSMEIDVMTVDAVSDEASIEADFDLAGGVLTAIAAFSTYDFSRDQDADFNPLPAARFVDDEDFTQYSGELRYVSDTSKPFYYLLGAFIQREELTAVSDASLNFPFLDAFTCANAGRPLGCSPLGAFPVLSRNLVLDQVSKSWALFGQANYRPTDRVVLTFGLRYGSNRKTASHTGLVLNANTGSVVPEPVPGLFARLPIEVTPHAYSRRISDTRFLPQVSARWEFTDDVNLYASYSLGSKDGGFNAAATSGNVAEFAYRPETSRAFEVGIKSQFADRRVTLNINYFNVRFEDLQTTQFTGSTSYVVSNAASARSQGVEFDFRWQMVDKLAIRGSGAYTDFTFLDFRNAGCTVGQISAGGFANGALCAAAGANDLTGRTNQDTPQFTFTGGLDFAQPIGDYKLRLGAEIEYSDSYFAASDLDAALIQPSFTRFNASASFGPADGGWEIGLVGRNLSNERIFSYGNDTPLFAGSYQVLVQRGRTIALRTSVKF